MARLRGGYNRNMRKLALQLCLAVALSQGLAASSFDGHMAKARQAIADKDFTTAESEYQAALRDAQKHPGDMRVFLAYEGLSNTAERQNDLQAAEAYLQHALEARRDAGLGPVAELPAWLDLRRFYAGQKRWLDAAAAADRLAGIWQEGGGGAQAGTAQYLSSAGFFYYSARDYAKAEERYRAALPILEAAKGNSAALAQVIDRLANALAAEEKGDEAEAQFKRAIAMSENVKWLGPAARDYRDFLRKTGRGDDANALEKSWPSGGVFRVGKSVTAPMAMAHREPEYTEAARVGRFMGTVIVYLEVDPSGAAANIQVLEGLGFGLDEKAVEAIETWKFRPGIREGQPVPVIATVEINFRLL
jgi:TonB family protein